LDIRQLRYFQVIAEELHFGRAASRLCVAQSALSRQIKQLEDEIGTLLLRRNQRRVELLPAGRVLQERSNQILEQLAKAIADTRRWGEGVSGRLSIGFIHSSTYGFLPSIVELFRKRHPEVELELQEMSIVEQHLALERGAIDVGLLRPQSPPLSLTLECITEETFLLAVSCSHDLAKRRKVSLENLANERMIMFQPQTVLHSWINSMCAEVGFVPRVSQYVSKIHTATGLVRAGIGIAIVPACARDLAQPGVQFLEIKPAPRPVPVALGWVRSRSDEPLIVEFRQIAREIAEKKVDTSSPAARPTRWTG